MGVLSSELRSTLQRSVLQARQDSEKAATAALQALRVDDERVTITLDEESKRLRRALRARMRQLGSLHDLVMEVAYEQWHLMLFARFLAENDLLMHPTARVPVTIAECGELAADLGEPDEWAVASRFASVMPPGVFRPDDPSLQVRFAAEARVRLERVLAALPSAVFTADDSLGWVYQFWQTDAKKAVNASGRKVGASDLAPVTQLFTEHSMVRFLLENSLGAWWATRHPDSPLLRSFEYLRRSPDGDPIAGEFAEWPDRVSDVTMIDPCCGSGHFLVEAFNMLVAMQMEESGDDPASAGNAVLRENLFGLELDPRCTQIAAFAIVLAAWKTGGGWRDLPLPNIACSGIPLNAPLDEWRPLADGNTIVEDALERLHVLFREADTLGSLIDPRFAAEGAGPIGRQRSFADTDWEKIAPLLERATRRESKDPTASVLGADAIAVARAADFLSRSYSLVATNVPWLKRGKQTDLLARFADAYAPHARPDLATVFLERCVRLLRSGGTLAAVSPQNWLTLGSFKAFRSRMLGNQLWHVVARLGAGAFETISGEAVKPVLTVTTNLRSRGEFVAIAADAARRAADKAHVLQVGSLIECSQDRELANPDSRVTFVAPRGGDVGLLSDVAESLVGMQTSDDPRYKMCFWEVSRHAPTWELFQDVPTANTTWSGCSYIVRWEQGHGPLASISVAWKGRNAWGRPGVIVARFGQFLASLYHGGKFHQNAAVVVPHDPALVPAILAFCQSSEFELSVREIDQKMNVTNATLVKVPFDPGRWTKEAEKAEPLGEPNSVDPRQWMFGGNPSEATIPLQVAVARLLGYRWPAQQPDAIDELVDTDGVVPIPAMAGELGASERLRRILERSYGGAFTPGLLDRILADSGDGARSLEAWLRDNFFEQHLREFQNRPFIWQIWDGRKDGFSALGNYHRLDRRLLEKITFALLGSWIEMQAAEARSGVTGADLRLAAAKELQRRLQLVLEGESPLDVFVRWKPTREQSIGWDRDINDGVRLNIRPFVEADVLRVSAKRMRSLIKWGTDRGKEADGSTRDNDVHLTLAEKHAARAS